MKRPIKITDGWDLPDIDSGKTIHDNMQEACEWAFNYAFDQLYLHFDYHKAVINVCLIDGDLIATIPMAKITRPAGLLDGEEFITVHLKGFIVGSDTDDS